MEQVYEITGYESVPEELKAVNNWIVWKREPTDKLDKNGEVRFKKVPYSPKTDDKASPTDPNAGSDFNTALSKEIDYDGLGFIFTGSPFLGVDLDNISNEIKEFESGNENNIVGEFYNQLETYTELSPSGTGLHFIMRGELPLGGRHKGDVEMYDTGRFFTITGDQFGDYENINNGTELIKPLHEKYLGSNDGVQGDYTDFEKIPSFGNGLSEDEVILALNKDPQSVIWLGLFFTGDYKAAGYSSRSEAELAFVGKLGFYSDYDKNMMDNIFKQSALCDEKWERASSPTKVYTIGRVINNRPKKGGYKSKKKNNFNITVNQNTDDWNSRKWEIIANKQKRKPTNEGSSTLIDGNGVLWVEKDGGKDKPPKIVLVRNYINHETMASLAVDLIQNEFTEYIEYIKDGKYEIVDDFFLSDMYRKVSEIYVDLPKRDMEHAINNLGTQKKYHPIKELITSTTWDKTERVETFFIDFFGLEDTSYYREATRKWFIAAVARLYEPGVKFDSTLVLRGKQGTGKTTAITKLAMESEFYVSLSERIDKDVFLNINSGWLVELEELEFLKNNSVGAVKKFLTATQDKYRMPYGRKEKFYKRHSVFIATINDKNFLKDKTGNRRFVPFMIDDNAEPVLSVFDDLTTDYVHQLWAEALEYYSLGESLVISEESEKQFDILRGEVEEIDITKDTLLEMLDLAIPHDYYSMTIEQKRSYLNGESKIQSNLVYREDITAKEILTEFFGRDIDGDLRGNTVAKEVNEIMLNLPNWKYDTNIKRKSPDGKIRRQRGFKRIS